MARVVATEFMTLDGVVEDPHKWSFPYWGDEIASFKDQELRDSDALLLGRVTYDGFAAAWPGRKDPDGFADKFNAMPKHVASRTREKLAWTNSHVLEGDLAPAVRKLKQGQGKDIVIHGSVSIVNDLTKAGLIDRYHLLVYPIVLGKGKRLFREDVHAKLRLVESRPMGKGVVLMVYEPAAEDAPQA